MDKFHHRALGHQWSVYDVLGWFCGPGPGSGSGTGFLSLKGSQGVALKSPRILSRDLFSCFCFESFYNLLKSTFGAYLVPNWRQNDPQKWAWVASRKHQKTISCKKPGNSNPLIIYHTSSMSTPPKTPPFWLLKSYKIKEKKNNEHEPQKNTKN